jgi:hypothetical protein
MPINESSAFVAILMAGLCIRRVKSPENGTPYMMQRMIGLQSRARATKEMET